jgi:hypothetical protein
VGHARSAESRVRCVTGQERERASDHARLTNRTGDRGLDQRDPWAGDIRYPALSPARYVVDAMNLVSDSEGREWRIEGDTVISLRSQVWGSFSEKDDESEHEDGSRIQVSFDFVQRFLQRENMDLIVKVEVERRRRYFRYERQSYNDYERISPSARLFLIRGDGSLSTI